MKKIYKKPLFWLGALLIPVGAAMLSNLKMTNVAETAPDHEDKTLLTRSYKVSGDLTETQKRIEAAIRQISTYGGSWKIAESKREGDSVMIQVEVPVVFFTDDLRIEFSQAADEIILNARSASRVGKGDFGENRRHILQLFEKLDEVFREK